MSSNIDTLTKMVKQSEFYVPRQYQTIGGMWTTDTWQRGDVKVQVMDEGYTTVITAPGLYVVSGYNSNTYVEFREGDYGVIEQLIKQFSEGS